LSGENWPNNLDYNQFAQNLIAIVRKALEEKDLN
jgi:hypothetical protein